jgi:hypothetical protein
MMYREEHTGASVLRRLSSESASEKNLKILKEKDVEK